MKLASLFSDGAVLQREMCLPVWGQAIADHYVRVELAGQYTDTKCGQDGRFIAYLPPMQAGGPYELNVVDLDTGNTLTVHDILIGEVWLASGQSNMEYELGSECYAVSSLPGEQKDGDVKQQQLREFQESVKDSGSIRFLTVPKCASGCQENEFTASWTYLDRDHAAACCACGAWFAKFVQDEIKVPVGIIASSWTGSIVEAWTSRSGLLANPVTAHMVRLHDELCNDEKNWRTGMLMLQSPYALLHTADPGNTGLSKGFAASGFDDSSWKEMQVPGSWIKQGIAGNGIVWARKKVKIPASWKDMPLRLELGSVDKQDITYVNGVEVGRMGSGYDDRYWNTKRSYPIPAGVVTATECTVAVRAYAFVYDGNFGNDPEKYALINEKTGDKINISGTWKVFPEHDFGVIDPKRLVIPPGPGNHKTPMILFDAMIHPLIPYAIRGVLWYQGESNVTSDLNDSLLYQSKIETMIRDWRYQWGQGDFPFIQVQLANYRKPASYAVDSGWAPLRDSQRLACESVKQVYMASAIDIGESDNIHPQNKKEVGRRLALQALTNVYHRDMVPFGPLFDHASQEPGAVRVHFRNGKGMYFQGGTPKGFYIGGLNCMSSRMAFFPAEKAVIEGNTVLLSSSEVQHPVAVRYAWSDNPDGNLYNESGLPASSFRSDSGPLT